MIAKILLFYNRYLNSVAVNNKQVSTDYMRETMLYQEKVKVTQSCPTLCETMDYTVHGILQARILKWVAFLFSKGSNLDLLLCRRILYQLSHREASLSYSCQNYF